MICEACKQEVKPRGMHFHKLYHCKPAAPNGQQKKQPKAPAAAKCDCQDGGKWEMLNPRDPRHAQVMQLVNEETGKAYRKYCTECREVY